MIVRVESAAYIVLNVFVSLQLEYLRQELAGVWGDRMITKIMSIQEKVPANSAHVECQFPQLAGSHLTEVGTIHPDT